MKYPADTYGIEFPVGESQVSRIHRIFLNNDNEKSFEHLTWQYLKAPAGNAYTAFSVSDSKADAAVYSVFKVQAKVYKDIHIAAQSLDTLTDKDHRGKGLFSALASAVFEKCAKDGVAFVYGFPNSNSAHGFFNKLGWKKIGFPPFRIYLSNVLFPLSYFFGRRLYLKNFLFDLYVRWQSRRKKRRFGLHVIDQPGYASNDYDALWGRFAESLPVTLWRSAAYMMWRYRDKPGRAYFHKSVYVNGQVAGLVVYTVLEKHGGKIGYVMDLIFEPNNPAIAEVLLADAVIHMGELRADAILAWADVSFPENKAFVLIPFLKLPRRLQPIKLYFGYRTFGGFSDASITNSDFFVSYADSDTV